MTTKKMSIESINLINNICISASTTIINYTDNMYPHHDRNYNSHFSRYSIISISIIHAQSLVRTMIATIAILNCCSYYHELSYYEQSDSNYQTIIKSTIVLLCMHDIDHNCGETVRGIVMNTEKTRHYRFNNIVVLHFHTDLIEIHGNFMSSYITLLQRFLNLSNNSN